MHSLIWFWNTGIHDPSWVQAVAAAALVVLTIMTLFYLRIYVRDTRSLAKTSVDQAGHVSEQTEILRQSVAAAQTSADAAYQQVQMMKDKERARLVLLALGEPQYAAARSDTDQEFVFVGVNMSIINDGETKAFNVRADGSLELNESTEPTREPLVKWEKLQIPEIVRETDAENPLEFTICSAATGDVFKIPQARLLDISNNTSFLWVTGVFVYDDVFGDFHRTPFCYRWKVDRAEHGASKWINHSETSS